ncbi:MAG: CYTH domain-containing protein [Candidatus Dojkabacteria bacterium]|jgi:predicted adenylyl cyclase CyaB|nr:CYTH domain-containing protein [Candidatus Dojkabacteria bacterium]
MSDTLLTIKESARVLKVHWQTIRNHIKCGDLKAHKIGRVVRIRREDIDRLLNSTKPRKDKIEIELRYLFKDRKLLEKRLLDLGAKISYHGHIIDHWYIPNRIKSREQEEEWFDKNRGCGLRIREQDNGYTGKVTVSLEAKRLTKEDMNHDTFLEAEIYVDSIENAKRLLELLDRKEFLVIDKNRIVYKYEDFKICIDDIKGFGAGVEIEIESCSTRETALEKIRSMAKRLGLQEKDRVAKSMTVLAFDKLAKYE